MKKRETMMDRLMAEKINYGGFAMSRIDVYLDMRRRGFPAHGGFDSCDWWAFHPPALTSEQEAELIPAERFAEIVDDF